MPKLNNTFINQITLSRDIQLTTPPEYKMGKILDENTNCMNDEKINNDVEMECSPIIKEEDDNDEEYILDENGNGDLKKRTILGLNKKIAHKSYAVDASAPLCFGLAVAAATNATCAQEYTSGIKVKRRRANTCGNPGKVKRKYTKVKRRNTTGWKPNYSEDDDEEEEEEEENEEEDENEEDDDEDDKDYEDDDTILKKSKDEGYLDEKDQASPKRIQVAPSTARSHARRWTESDDDKVAFLREYGHLKWHEVTEFINGRHTPQAVQMRYLRSLKRRNDQLTSEETAKLRRLVTEDYETRFKRLSTAMGPAFTPVRIQKIFLQQCGMGAYLDSGKTWTKEEISRLVDEAGGDFDSFEVPIRSDELPQRAREHMADKYSKTYEELVGMYVGGDADNVVIREC